MPYRRFLAFLCGLLLALACALAALAGLIDGAGGSGALMCTLMQQHAPSSATGLPEEHYPAMADMIAGYLSGREQTFQFTYAAEGAEHVCFREKEQLHMADCKALFDLDRAVLLAAAFVAAALACGAYALRQHRRQAALGALWGCLLPLAAVLGLILWGAVDFDGLFILFHRLSFANELWLLNPQTDLLICLMPTSFFIHYAALLGGTWLGLLLLMAASAWRLSVRWKQ